MTYLYDALLSAMAGNGSAFAALGGAFSERAADLAVAAIWQGALIACGLALCLRFAPRMPAAHRFTVWAAAFFTLVSLPVLAMVADLPIAAVRAVSFESAGTAAEPWLKFDARWSLVIAGLWALASLVRATDLAIHTWKLRKIWRDATPLGVDANVSAVLDRLNGRVEVCTTKALDRPSVIGFFRPRILIPDWLFARLTPGELEQIVMHEVEHLERRDDWTNLLQKLCLVVFPLNPSLIWIERRLCREREMACDEGVIRITRAPRAYAACLANLAQRGLERRAAALSLGAWHRRPELVHRVHSILRGKRGLSPVGARVLLGTVGCGLLMGAVELAQCPQLVAFVPERSAQVKLTEDASAAANSIPTLAAREAAGMEKPQSGMRAAHRQKADLARLVSYSPILAAEDAARLGHPNPMGQPNSMRESAPAPLQTRSVAYQDHAPRAVMLKAEIPDLQAAAAPEQQWVVLTTWRVETTSQSAAVKSDYDANSGAEQKPDAATTATAASDANAEPGAQQSSQPASRITVTRLILRVFPASAGSNSSTNPLTGQPGVAVVHGGWLVFQL